MVDTIQHQHGVLKDIDPLIGTLMDRHVARHKPWTPTDLVPKSHQVNLLPADVAAMLVLNLLTEDGLPYFLSLIVKHLGDERHIWRWARRWTAEENRHGKAIGHYLRAALTDEQMACVERAEQQYLEQGFWPNWNGLPYRLIAYVVMQEMATQMSHAGIARSAQGYDPVLVKLLGKVAGEEKAHHDFYLGVLKNIINCDPVGAIDAIWQALKSFAMPGGNMPHFQTLAYIQERQGVFGPAEMAKIVDVVISRLELTQLGGLKNDDEKGRDLICVYPNRLRKIADRSQRKPAQKIHLPFLGDDVFITL